MADNTGSTSPSNSNPNPAPAPATPAPVPTPAPARAMTWQDVVQKVLGIVVTAATAILGDWVLALIIASAVLGPFIYPRSRPVAIATLRWLKASGVNGVELLERMYGYTVPTKLKSWIDIAIAVTTGGFVLQVAGSGFLGAAIGIAPVVFLALVTLASLIALIMVRRTIQTANGAPTKAEIRRSLESEAGLDHFIATFGHPTDPMPSLLTLFCVATFLGIGHAYFVGAVAGPALFARVYGVFIGVLTMAGTGLAFQVLFTLIAKLGTATFIFLAKPTIGVARVGFVAAAPGITPANQDKILGPPAEFGGILEGLSYLLLAGAFGLVHIVSALAFDAPQLAILSGLLLIATAALYLAKATNNPLVGIVFGAIVGGVFVLRALWTAVGSSYWTTLHALSFWQGVGYLLAVVAVVFVLTWLVGYARRRADELGGYAVYPWFGLGAALLALLLVFPLMHSAVSSAANPAPPTAAELEAQRRIDEANEDSTAQMGVAQANLIRRNANRIVELTTPSVQQPTIVNQPAPAPRHRSRSARRSGGPCDGMPASFIRNNPRQCGG